MARAGPLGIRVMTAAPGVSRTPWSISGMPGRRAESRWRHHPALLAAGPVLEFADRGRPHPDQYLPHPWTARPAGAEATDYGLLPECWVATVAGDPSARGPGISAGARRLLWAPDVHGHAGADRAGWLGFDFTRAIRCWRPSCCGKRQGSAAGPGLAQLVSPTMHPPRAPTTRQRHHGTY